MRKRLALSFLFAAASPALAAGTFTVSNSSDAGAGSLRQAIVDANLAGGGTINIPAGLITLQSPLPILSTPITINGGNAIISGNNQYRVFFVDAPPASPVNISDLTITGGRAKGGDGGINGGGGLGAGGGVFLNSANLTLSNVSFASNSAVGGNGGGETGAARYGAGGGLGGNGASGVGGGGGYQGAGGTLQGGGGGFDSAGQNGNGSVGGSGGGQGGTGFSYGGGAGFTGSGGGGGSLQSFGGNATGSGAGTGGKFGGGGGSGTGLGGDGGEFGGGGAGSTRGGNGGFGGGGGYGSAVGGNGGFGGGGGGSDSRPAYGLGGAFGGNAGPMVSPPLLGGGGAALGGHLFVRGGASLTLSDVSADAGTVTPGLPGTYTLTDPASPGKAAGSSFFLSGITNFSVSAGKARVISGTIADAYPYLQTTTAASFVAATLVKTGAGSLQLTNASNSYSGGTIISQGTLIADSSPVLGVAPVTLNDANTGTNDTRLIMGFSVFGPISVAGLGSGTTTLETTAQSTFAFDYTGSLQLGRTLTFVGRSTYPQDPAHNTAQNRLSCLIIGTGGLTITGGNLVQFSGSPKSYSGQTTITGNTSLSLNDAAFSPLNSVVQIDAGSSLVLEAIGNGATIGGLTGAGSVLNNANRGGSSLLNLANTTGGVHTFTGTLGAGIALSQSGGDTFELGVQNNTAVSLRVTSGSLRLLGDQLVSSFEVQKNDPGTQAADLNGHSVRLISYPLGLAGVNSRLRTLIGDASDGIYDSTATARDAVGYQYPAPGGGLLLKLTRRGDANLDNLVSFNDLVTVAQHYGKTGGGNFGVYWDTGDFNYDGNVDFADLVAIAQNYGSTFPSAPIPGATPSFNSDLAAAFASVPEPSSLTLAGVATFAFLKRRRKVWLVDKK